MKIYISKNHKYYQESAETDFYTALGAEHTRNTRQHILQIKSSTNIRRATDVKAATDGGSTFYHVAKVTEKYTVNNTLTMDKPINLGPGDKLRVLARK